MKRCLQIFPSEESPLVILSDEGQRGDQGFTVSLFSFDRNNIAASPLDEEAVWHDLLEEKLSGQTYDAVLIDRTVRDQEATIIIAHIRLSSEESISGVPVIFYNQKKLAETLKTSTLKHKDTLISGNVNYIWEKNYDDDKALTQKLQRVIIHNTQPQAVDLSLLRFRQNDEGTRHQITNEWGAFFLAHVAGLTEIARTLLNYDPKSKTIYFKYLRLRHNIDLPTGDLISSPVEVPSQTKNYLFIDDNYDKGWQEVFNAILGQVDSALGLEPYTDVEKFENRADEPNTFQGIIDQIKQNNYQGILLDLRLTNDDNNPSRLNTAISEFTGGRLLKEIKAAFPHLPVIMTTASNKAWNMEQLLDEGADGYFIKQGPDSLPNENMARENYDSFLKLIKNSQEKHKRLQAFWQYIKAVEQGTLIEERQVSVIQADGTQVQADTKVEERIIERLNMFFGLLKRSFEDSTYNKRFHYSDYKLAFMTLWSCLNDIQYIYYDKSELGWTSTKGKENFNIKIVESIRTSLNLPNSLDSDFYLQKGKVKADGTEVNKFETCLKVDYNVSTPYSLLSSSIDKDVKGNKINFSGSIGEQIGFLLLTFDRGAISDNSLSTQSAQRLANNLVRIKKKRNHIYLTHGNEKEGSDFFVKKESENPEVSLQDCTQLFEIVYFLLKGHLIKFNIPE